MCIRELVRQHKNVIRKYVIKVQVLPKLFKLANHIHCRFFKKKAIEGITVDTGNNKFVEPSKSILQSRNCISVRLQREHNITKT
jgi:hypothetical protein